LAIALRARLIRLSHRARDAALQRAHFRGKLSQPVSVQGGVVLEADWNGKVLWELRHPDHHHVGILLRNGNVLMNCLGTVPAEIARQVKGGTEDHNLPSALYAPQPQEDAGVMYADYLDELTPAGETVWEWRSWEHFDPVADGISEVQADAVGNGQQHPGAT